VTDLVGLSLRQAADLVRTRQVSPVEIAQTALDRVQALGPRLNCLISVADDLLEQAGKSEREILRGRYRGTLHGLTVVVKDNLLTRDLPTSGGSLVVTDWRSRSGRDAHVVAALRTAGALILGKTNLYELAYGYPHASFGTVTNPLLPGFTTGGSSNGSAAAAAAHLAYAAIGTDTGGSIRIPAAFCGLVGVKPTLGRVGRSGIIPLSTTLDHVGPLTRHVGDAAAVLDAISGRDNGDPTTMRQDVGSVSAHLDEGVSKLRIGLLSASPTEVEEPLIAKAVECAASGLTDLGASVREIDISWLAEARYVGGILTAVEAAEFHRDLVHENPSGYSPVILRRLRSGSVIPGADYIRAQRARAVLAHRSDELFAHFDAVVLPATLMKPLPIEQWVAVLGNSGQQDTDSYKDAITRFTSAWNVTGQPSVVLPFDALPDGTPAAVQIVGPRSADDVVLRIARSLEGVRPWQEPRPISADAALTPVGVGITK
jgi:aspartyl-tRNA(Asn)/glutamyl-tRNA(Gln) amidotransferase subunit A